MVVVMMMMMMRVDNSVVPMSQPTLGPRQKPRSRVVDELPLGFPPSWCG